ncbi:flagellar biosynthesis anti-sigma factor FlgM [Clostridium tunisiense]|uniref:flagellar biosynthesis anti-sigma factor FlgM n=1 Tax=Clostridium tunisiense TaxID=219748 RepID=UPI0002DFCD9E|nr:flagellar biosynthesis anti-sigma factor FlgM [Clostridium tunisiense]
MKINNLNNVNNVKYINSYKSNDSKSKKGETSQNNDKCEISLVGKALNNLSIEKDNLDMKSAKEVENIKKQIVEGKYKVDSKALTDKLMDVMKGRV